MCWVPVANSMVQIQFTWGFPEPWKTHSLHPWCRHHNSILWNLSDNFPEKWPVTIKRNYFKRLITCQGQSHEVQEWMNENCLWWFSQDLCWKKLTNQRACDSKSKVVELIASKVQVFYKWVAHAIKHEKEEKEKNNDIFSKLSWSTTKM